MNYINTKTACSRLGVHPNTLRNWDKEGKIKTIRTPGGNRLYDLSSISQERTKIIYSRLDLEMPFILLFPNGDMRLKAGFAFDGPTGTPDIEELMFPSAFHDALYRMIRVGLLPIKYKKKADETLVILYKKVATKEKIPKAVRDIMASLVGKGVEAFGGIGLAEGGDEVKEAPSPDLFLQM